MPTYSYTPSSGRKHSRSRRNSIISISESGTILTVKRELGQGGFGDVRLFVDETGEIQLAVKRFNNAENMSHDALGSPHYEAEITRLVKGNTTKLIELPDGDTRMIMPFVRGETLYTLLSKDRQPPSPLLFNILIDAIKAAIEAYNIKGILHIDLNLNNILVELKQNGAYIIEIIDWGLAVKKGQPVALERLKIMANFLFNMYYKYFIPNDAKYFLANLTNVVNGVNSINTFLEFYKTFVYYLEKILYGMATPRPQGMQTLHELLKSQQNVTPLSLTILINAINTAIDIYKTKKILHIDISLNRIFVELNPNESSTIEIANWELAIQQESHNPILLQEHAKNLLAKNYHFFLPKNDHYASFRLDRSAGQINSIESYKEFYEKCIHYLKEIHQKMVNNELMCFYNMFPSTPTPIPIPIPIPYSSTYPDFAPTTRQQLPSIQGSSSYGYSYDLASVNTINNIPCSKILNLTKYLKKSQSILNSIRNEKEEIFNEIINLLYQKGIYTVFQYDTAYILLRAVIGNALVIRGSLQRDTETETGKAAVDYLNTRTEPELSNFILSHTQRNESVDQNSSINSITYNKLRMFANSIQNIGEEQACQRLRNMLEMSDK